MWLYLEQLANLLENVANVLSLVSVGDIQSIRQELYANSRRRNSLTPQSPAIATARLPRLTSVGIPDVTGEPMLPW